MLTLLSGAQRPFGNLPCGNGVKLKSSGHVRGCDRETLMVLERPMELVSHLQSKDQ